MGKPKFVILEYGVADGTLNPFNYDPYPDYPQLEKRPLTDSEYFTATVITKTGTTIDCPMSIQSCRHMSESVGTITRYKKFDFDIVSLQYKYAEPWIEANKNDIFVLTASVGSFFNEAFLSKYRDTFYMAVSAGNEAELGETEYSGRPYWTSIGAVSPNMNPSDYSSWGKGTLDFVGKTDEILPYSYLGVKFTDKLLRGTSFACPQHGTQIMNLMMSMYNKTGIRPSIAEVIAIRNKYVQDINIPNIVGVGLGKDLKTGFGYYEYAEGQFVEPKKTIKMKVNDVNAQIITSEETRNIVLSLPPTVTNGTTLVPIRFVAEALGLKVEYIATTKEIVLKQY